MGIRFYCPNGHRLNVKAFLAGKRAKCPHCGAKVRVPTESTLGHPPEQSAPMQGRKIAHFPSVSGETVPRETAGDLSPAAPDVPSVSDSPVWYMRLPSGDQYGPASSEMLETWVQEGRVPDDAWVWQPGWPDWLRACDVPLLGNAVLPDSTMELDEGILDVQHEPMIIPASLARYYQRKDRTVLVVSILSLACLILLGALLWILSRSK